MTKSRQCEYCSETGNKVLVIKSNCSSQRKGALIANGENSKELIFFVELNTYGIPIKYCPICGRKLEE